jgi:nitrite reductase/ring-hydroxylating ferredoxin subunit
MAARAATEKLVRATSLEELRAAERLVVHVDGHTVVLFLDGDGVHACDNRCPHMGFPLHRGSIKDGILTCHWHHARFDLCSGGTFDQWADDLRTYPVELAGDDVLVDLTPRRDPVQHQRKRLRDGLERNIGLVVAKAVVTLADAGRDPAEAYSIGLDFGVRNRRDGWGQGLTMLTCFMNVLPLLEPEDRKAALYHGLTAVAVDSDGHPPRFQIDPLPDDAALPALKTWFRQFVEVRDAEGAERCLVSAVRAGGGSAELADMLFAAATDHRYIRGGHVLDFTNKALEGLDAAGWKGAEPVLGSLAAEYASAERMEEANEWRHPIDLVEILERAFEELQGVERSGSWDRRAELVDVLLDEDPQSIADALLAALRAGASDDDVAGAVSYAAALRIARFPTSNEFGDWDTALHTFTFANAVQQGLRRAPSVELLRGVFDAAMSVYLDRFLNVPAVRLPEGDAAAQPDELLEELPVLLDRQQQVNEAGALVTSYLAAGGEDRRLLAALGAGLVREDRDFHTIQCVEAAFRQYADLGGTQAGTHVLVAAARYLAAHAPTTRAQRQTLDIARRLQRGERLYEDEVGASEVEAPTPTPSA